MKKRDLMAKSDFYYNNKLVRYILKYKTSCTNYCRLNTLSDFSIRKVLLKKQFAKIKLEENIVTDVLKDNSDLEFSLLYV